MKPKISMREALSDPDIFYPIMAGESWYPARTLLIAAAGEELNDDEREIFRKLTGRAREPGRMCHDLVAIFGRRGGKTMMLAVFVCWISALCDHSDTLGLASGVALIISRDQRASQVMLNYCEQILTSSPILAQLIVGRTADSISLVGNISIEVRPCNRVSSRGMTAISICADELAHWFSSADVANPDFAVLGAARPALLTTSGPVLMASSVYAKHGVLFDAFKKDYGANGKPDIIVAYGTSRDLNPGLSQEYIDRELERDPLQNRAEYLSEWRSDVEGFIAREVVERCVREYIELPPMPNTVYVCFVDPASGVPGGDSYAICIAHKLGDRVIIDVIREIQAPFDAFEVIDNVLVPLCKAYRITKVFGDNYAGELAKLPVRKAGIGYELAEKHVTQLYLDPFLGMLNAGKLDLPNHQRGIAQICSLERSTQRSGRDQISHPPRSHDDIANAIAGAVDLARGHSGYTLEPFQPGYVDRDIAPDAKPMSSADNNLLNLYKGLAGPPSKPAEPIWPRPRSDKPIWPW